MTIDKEEDLEDFEFYVVYKMENTKIVDYYGIYTSEVRAKKAAISKLKEKKLQILERIVIFEVYPNSMESKMISNFSSKDY